MAVGIATAACDAVCFGRRRHGGARSEHRGDAEVARLLPGAADAEAAGGAVEGAWRGPYNLVVMSVAFHLIFTATNTLQTFIVTLLGSVALATRRGRGRRARSCSRTAQPPQSGALGSTRKGTAGGPQHRALYSPWRARASLADNTPDLHSLRVWVSACRSLGSVQLGLSYGCFALSNLITPSSGLQKLREENGF